MGLGFVSLFGRDMMTPRKKQGKKSVNWCDLRRLASYLKSTGFILRPARKQKQRQNG